MEPGNVIVIDDEKTICSACRMTLSEKGFSVSTFTSGKEGMSAVLNGACDIVLLDMKLPDLDGMEILETIRKEKAGVYIIVMTGYSTVQNAVEAMKLGAFDYLAKPFSDDELALAIEKAMGKKHLVEQNRSLRKEPLVRGGFNNIVGENPVILRIFDKIRKVAPTDSIVLIIGESGTGKELFAGSIHVHSKRAGQQFVAVDCSTLSPGLLESELFGHIKGAFTGAVRDKAGIFEVAHGGTLFLDDIANLNLDIQAKLLRVLETNEYKPVGASYFKKTNARIIAATNKDLKTMVEAGDFREDLYYRFNVFPLYLPPLRERRDDIPRLAYYFLRHFCRKTGKRIQGFTDDALETLVKHNWPGNVRQLKNAIERLVILSDTDTVDLLYLEEHLHVKYPWTGGAIPDTLDDLKEVKKYLLEEQFGRIQKAFLIKALKKSKGNISRAAENVGMKRPNFSALMKRYHISANGAGE